jgi:glycosyltransferase involved in cell wall biosynthesis
MEKTYLSVVIPVQNETLLIDELIKQVVFNVEKINQFYELIIIDDGSTDDTWNKIEVASNGNRKIKGIQLSRNFGQHYAITAGLQKVLGEWTIVMDGDLQDRPEVITDLYAKAKEGFEIVFVSRKNRPENILYRILQRFFYILLNQLSGLKFNHRQANFSILSKNVVKAYNLFPENSRFYGSTINWLGFKRGEIIADHGTRYAGKSSYSIKKRIRLAIDIILSFSERPLKLIILIGTLLLACSLICLILVVSFFLIEGKYDYGWTAKLLIVSFSVGLLMCSQGIIALYVGRVHTEVKKRPLYVIKNETS